MAEYKVRIDDTIYKVEGLPGLVRLIREGRLGPEDPVYVPRTGKWHYAKSIRQLRDHFPAEAPPPPAPAATESSVSRPDFQASQPVVREVPAGNGDARVLPLKTKGRREMDAREPLDVPVYAYGVDVETPPWIRRAILFGIVLAVGGALAIWVAGQRAPRKNVFVQPSYSATPPPSVGVALKNTPTRGNPNAKATPDVREMRTEVRALPSINAKNIPALEKAILEDLTRLRVPVRSVRIIEGKSKNRDAVPFTVKVVHLDKASKRDERRMLIGLAVGRAIAVTKLNVGTLVIEGHRGGKTQYRRKTTGAAAKTFYAGGDPDTFLNSLKKP